MRSHKINKELDSIVDCLSALGLPSYFGTISQALSIRFAEKTLQRRLKVLVDEGRILAKGASNNRAYSLIAKSSVNYTLANKVSDLFTSSLGDKHPFFSNQSMEAMKYLETPHYARVKNTYNFCLVDNYIPNETAYVSAQLRERLRIAGKRFDNQLAAGTYAEHIAERLLIDLSFNSSRLEGNTYSELDTKILIEQGASADGKVKEETVMIMNHKECIEYLIGSVDDISLNPYTIRNIHHLLSQDLLVDSNACGVEREREVFIGKSAYKPLNNPHKIKEYLRLLLLKAEKITDAFEQSFFLLMHLSYLQAFVDVNKRTARLTCNIPFIKKNLCPLSFVDVTPEDYFKALLYFYETNNFQPAIELYEWAYLRSCEQYDVVKESLGEIDSYRIQYRVARKEAMGLVIRENQKMDSVKDFLFEYCSKNEIPLPDKFVAMTINDLDCLHEGSIVGLGITEAMFRVWLINNVA